MLIIIKRYAFYFVLSILLPLTLIAQTSYEKSLALYEAKDYYDSIEILENIMLSNASDVNSMLLLVDNYISIKNYVQAKNIISKIKQKYPRLVAAFVKELQVAVLENQSESQIQNFINNIKSIDNRNYYASYYEGLLAQNKGYINDAIKLYEYSLSLTNNAPEASFALSYLYQMKNETQKALDLLNKNRINNVNSEQSYYHLANIYYINKNYLQASNEIKKALYLYPTYTEALVLDANIKSAMGLYDEAISNINKIQDSSINNLEKNYMIANIYEKQDENDLARQNYKLFLDANINNEIVRIGPVHFNYPAGSSVILLPNDCHSCNALSCLSEE